MDLNIKECTTIQELNEQLKNCTDVRISRINAVVYLFDSNNKIIYQRRGPKCRDKRLKLEGIGGGIDETDGTIKEAIIREAREECGNDCKIFIDDYLGVLLEKTYDFKDNIEKNILILGYTGRLISGELKIKEPDKCLGYERYNLENINLDDLSSSALFFYKKIKGMNL